MGEGMECRSSGGASRFQRVAWLIGIWVASVIALGIVAGAFRLMMAWAGMTPH